MQETEYKTFDGQWKCIAKLCREEVYKTPRPYPPMLAIAHECVCCTERYDKIANRISRRGSPSSSEGSLSLSCVVGYPTSNCVLVVQYSQKGDWLVLHRS